MPVLCKLNAIAQCMNIKHLVVDTTTTEEGSSDCYKTDDNCGSTETEGYDKTEAKKVSGK